MGLDPRTKHAGIFNKDLKELREMEEQLLELQAKTDSRSNASKRKLQTMRYTHNPSKQTIREELSEHTDSDHEYAIDA